MLSVQVEKVEAPSTRAKTEGGAGENTAENNMERLRDKLNVLVSANAVVVFTVRDCCLCHVVKQLLFGLGVGPTIVELGRGSAGLQPIPAVFVGGKFLGGIESVMACHINGTLIPLLKDAGALWL